MLNDLSNKQAVIKAIESNMASFWMQYGRAEGAETFEDDRLMYFSTGLAHPLFNAVFGTRLTRNEIEPTISEIVEKFSARKLPVFWWTGPGTLPSDLGVHLTKQGFHGGGYTPGMAIELSSLPDSVPVPDHFQIELVTDTTALRQWVELLAASNEMDSSLYDSLYEQQLRRGLNEQRYIGRLDGKPVGVSMLHLADGVAGLYAAATLPEARGKGIGAAMTLQPLLDGRKAGYKVGVLQASAMGYSVYKRLGFRDFCELQIFYLPTG
jgi:GNAT superfamily N-acetyltransferase